MTDEEKRQRLERYVELAHAVQTGIAWTIAQENPNCPDINANANLCAHKHLRVGIDMSKSDHGALVTLLIEKGVFTEEEYSDAILAGARSAKFGCTSKPCRRS